MSDFLVFDPNEDGTQDAPVAMDVTGSTDFIVISAGAPGPQGIQGPTGPTGKSAYQIAVENGYVGTEAQWSADLLDKYTQAEVDALLAPKADAASVTSALALKADASNVYTKAQVDTKVSDEASARSAADAALTSAVNLKADATNVYTKAEVDAEFALKADLTTLESYTSLTALADEANTRAAADTALSGRLDSLEAIDHANFTTDAELTAEASARSSADASLQTQIDSKAAASHTHTASNVTDLAEAVQDIVGAMAVQGSNITLAYDDVAGTLTISSTGGVDAEAVRDVIGTALVAGSNIDIAVNDAGDTITVSVTGLTTASISGLDAALAGKQDTSTLTETVQDIVGAMLIQGTNMTVTYNDATGTVTLDADGGAGGTYTDADAVAAVSAALVEGSNVTIDTTTTPGSIIISATSGGTGLPAGGTAGQTLVKQSGTDGDASWGDFPDGKFRGEWVGPVYSPTGVVRTNRFVNPGFESGAISPFTSFVNPGGVATDPVHSGTQSGYAAGGNGGDSYIGAQPAPGVPSGTEVTISAYGYATHGTTAGRARKIDLFVNAGAGYVEHLSDPVPQGAWGRVSVTATVPAGVTDTILRLYNGSGSGAEYVFWDDILIEYGPTVGDYFDGDTPDTGIWRYAWTGTPNASTSTATEYELVSGPNYSAGDYVVHNGRLWRSDIDSNGFEPGTSNWTEVPLTVDAADISDSTATGRSVLTAADAAAARTAIGAIASSDAGTAVTYLGAKVSRTTAQSIPAATYTYMTWTAEEWDTSSLFDPGTPDRFVVPAGMAGRWEVGYAVYEAAGTSPTTTSVWVNGVQQLGILAAGVQNSTYGFTARASGELVLAAGDVVQVRVHSNSATTASGSMWMQYLDRSGLLTSVDAAAISDSTATGRSVLTAADAAAARAAIGAGTGSSDLTIGTTSTTAKAGDYQPAAANISDSTATGRAVLTAASKAAGRTALDAVGSTDITSIVKLTQAAYDALGTKDASTLYVIVG